MRQRIVVLATAVVLLVTFGVTPALAQRRTGRTPTEGMWGLGGSVGSAAPTDASLQSGLEVSGNLETYLTSRVSVRGQVGTSWSDITGRHFTGTITPTFFDANVVYNWEGGVIHPFITAGVGVYHFHASESATQDQSDTKAGLNGGGGLEFFFDRRTTLTGEVGYHKVGAFNTPLATFDNGSFWRVALGLKRYF
jgi:opacity protein-like surface antigen